MLVTLTTHTMGHVVIVDVRGDLTLAEGASALREKIWELVEGGAKRILLNMASVSYIDSSGLGDLVAAYTTVTTAGGEMKLLNLTGCGHDLLKITKLYKVFESFEDEAAAIGTFSVPTLTDLQKEWRDSIEIFQAMT